MLAIETSCQSHVNVMNITLQHRLSENLPLGVWFSFQFLLQIKDKCLIANYLELSDWFKL